MNTTVNIIDPNTLTQGFNSRTVSIDKEAPLSFISRPTLTVTETGDRFPDIKTSTVRLSFNNLKERAGTLGRIIVYYQSGKTEYVPSGEDLQGLEVFTEIPIISNSGRMDVVRKLTLYDTKGSMYSFFSVYLDNKNVPAREVNSALQSSSLNNVFSDNKQLTGKLVEVFDLRLTSHKFDAVDIDRDGYWTAPETKDPVFDLEWLDMATLSQSYEVRSISGDLVGVTGGEFNSIKEYIVYMYESFNGGKPETSYPKKLRDNNGQWVIAGSCKASKIRITVPYDKTVAFWVGASL